MKDYTNLYTKLILFQNGGEEIINNFDSLLTNRAILIY